MRPKTLLAKVVVGPALAFALAASGCATSTVRTAAPAPPAPPAEPAMWVVRDADSTIYLFGTVHVMKPGTVWKTPRVQAALTSAEELVLEIEEVDDPNAMAPVIQRYGLDLTRPLSSRLTEAERAKLGKAAAAMGANAAAFEPMRPWLVSLQLVVGSLMKAGYDPNMGVDRLLKAAAVQSGQKVTAFETVEQQMRFFAELPPEVEMELFRQSLEDFDEGAAVFDPLADGWARGDLSVLERYLVTEWKAEAPDLYRVLIVQRNQDWARQIEARLKGKGVSFIAVGAGHLVGPDSVQRQLEARGIRSARY